MDNLLIAIFIYAFLLITGFPFIWMIMVYIWRGISRKWQWNSHNKFLLKNSLLYPLVFAVYFFTTVFIFGVQEDLSDAISTTIKDVDLKHPSNIQSGKLMTENNIGLAILFISFISFIHTLTYAVVVIPPIVLVGLIYFVLSTVLYNKKNHKGAMFPILVSFCVGIFLIVIGYILRTPIFNIFSSIV